MSAITSTPVLVSNQLKEFGHILMSIDIAKQVQQEKAWRIVARGAVNGITVSNQRSYERKIDKRCNHLGYAAFDISVWKDFNKAFFKAIV
jgi:hypothetical protein